MGGGLDQQIKEVKEDIDLSIKHHGLFVMAREHAPSINFGDEVDRVGSARMEFRSGIGDSEVQRTMLELLNRFDGPEAPNKVKALMATNRRDNLDQILLKPGHIDIKIEIPNPNEEFRVDILKNHSRRMKDLGRIARTMQGKGFKARYGYSPPIQNHYIPGTTINYEAERILDNENHMWEVFLNDNEIILEGKALNSHLINFLQEKDQVELLLRYIVEEDFFYAERRRSFEVPFIACEIFTYKIDIIMRKFVEDVGLMKLPSSFLEPSNLHNTQLVEYFGMVVVCLLLQEIVSPMNLIQSQPATVKQLVDFIRITSIREVRIRLIGVDECRYPNNMDVVHWIEDSEALEMILNKLSSSDSSEALEGPKPKSVLVNSLFICVSYLNTMRSTTCPYHAFNRQLNLGSGVSVHPKIIEGMLGYLSDFLRMLDFSSLEKLLPTPNGKLQTSREKHGLKLVEFITALVNAGGQTMDKELVHQQVVS